MLRNIFFHKNMVGENSPPSRFLKEKRRSAKSDVSKVLFPDIGKITNRFIASSSATLKTKLPTKLPTKLLHYQLKRKRVTINAIAQNDPA